MWSSKKVLINLFLILAMVMVWSWIFYSFFYTVDKTEVATQPESKIPMRTQENQNVYSLKLDYKDPFLKNIATQFEQETKIRSNEAFKPVQKQKVNWPAIAYFGLIRNKKGNKDVLALIEVNSKSHIVETNDQMGEIVVKAFNHDSITLAISNEVKSFSSRIKAR